MIIFVRFVKNVKQVKSFLNMVKGLVKKELFVQIVKDRRDRYYKYKEI